MASTYTGRHKYRYPFPEKCSNPSSFYSRSTRQDMPKRRIHCSLAFFSNTLDLERIFIMLAIYSKATVRWRWCSVGITGVTGYYFWHNCILWNWDVHFDSHTESSLLSGMNEINLINTIPSCSSYILFVVSHIFQVFLLSSVFPLQISYEILFYPTSSYWRLYSSICKPYSSAMTSARSHFSFSSAIQNCRSPQPHSTIFNFFSRQSSGFSLRILIF